MSDNWYYARGGQQFGPYSPGQLRQLADAGQLLPSDQLWSEGMGMWIEASKASLLFAPQQQVPTPAAPPSATPVGGNPYPAQAAPSQPAATPTPAPGTNPMPGNAPGAMPQGPAFSNPSQPTAPSTPAQPANGNPQKPGMPSQPGSAGNAPQQSPTLTKPTKSAKPLTATDDDSIDPKVMIGTAAVVVPILIASLAFAFWPRGNPTEVASELSTPEPEAVETQSPEPVNPTPNPIEPIDPDLLPRPTPPKATTPPVPVVPEPPTKTEPLPPVEPPKVTPPKTVEPEPVEPKKVEPKVVEPKTTEPPVEPPKKTEEPPPPKTTPPPETIADALADDRLFGTLYDKTLVQIARESPAALGAELCITKTSIELASEDLFQYIDVKGALLSLAGMEELRVTPPKNVGGFVTDTALKLPQSLLAAGLDEKRVLEVLGEPTGERSVAWKTAGEGKEAVTYVTWYDGLLGYANGTFWLDGPKVVEALKPK